MPDIEKLPTPDGGLYVATLFNAHPDARCLVVVSRMNRKTRISFPGDDFSLNDGWASFGDEPVGNDDYRLIYSVEANLNDAPFASKGFGLMLYGGTALAARQVGASGIYSVPGSREPEAGCLWAAMMCETDAESKVGYRECKKKVRADCVPIAFHSEGEESDKEFEVYDFCHPISDRQRDLDDDGYVISDEVCGTVMARKSETTDEIDVLPARNILKRYLVVDFAGHDIVTNPVPADIAVRTRLVRGEEGDESYDATTILAVAAMFRRCYDDAVAEEFLSRADVYRVLAEAAGQQRMQFEGLGASVTNLLAKIQRNPRPLRPLSARSRRIIETFDPDMP